LGVGDQRTHDLRVRRHELDGELLARVEVGQQRRDERLAGRVAGGQAHDGSRVPDADHDLGDLVGCLQQRARVPVQPPSGRRESDAARRSFEQSRTDLGLQRRQALGQRRLRDVQAHRGAPQAAQVGRHAEAAQLVEVGAGGQRGHDTTIAARSCLSCMKGKRHRPQTRVAAPKYGCSCVVSPIHVGNATDGDFA
jgi:hypothetical protein